MSRRRRGRRAGESMNAKIEKAVARQREIHGLEVETVVPEESVQRDARGWLKLGCCTNFSLTHFDSREAKTTCLIHGNRLIKLPRPAAI